MIAIDVIEGAGGVRDDLRSIGEVHVPMEVCLLDGAEAGLCRDDERRGSRRPIDGRDISARRARFAIIDTASEGGILKSRSWRSARRKRGRPDPLCRRIPLGREVDLDVFRGIQAGDCLAVGRHRDVDGFTGDAAACARRFARKLHDGILDEL